MSKVLIIEDETSIAELERDYLEISGFEVDLSHDGKEGLDLAINRDYDLMIIDIILPSVDGFEICKRVREKKDTPIMLVSAKKEDIDKVRGLGIGADDYITKPFSPSELVARVKAHIARYIRLVGKKGKKVEIVEIGGIKIDKSNRNVVIDGDEKFFTAKEFDLLFFLVQHPNRVFSKEDLFRAIWGLESLGDIATVTVHIKKLREKVEKDPTNPKYIETIWGVGYRFKI